MYDVIVIGGGPAGYHGALRAAGEGFRVALISDQAPGGVCLHTGCIPSKTVLHSTKLSLDESAFAIFGGVHPVDLPVLHERTEGIINRLSRGIAHSLKRAGVEWFEESAEILPKRDRYFAVRAGSEVLMGERLILATGSSERPLPFENRNHSTVTSVQELLESSAAPRSLLIIGAGGIGLEMATIFSRCGSEVTVVERENRIAPHFDPDLTSPLLSELEKSGIKIYTGTSVCSVNNGVVTLQKEDEEFTITVDRILPAMGRIPQSNIPGISQLNVKCSRDGAVKVSSCGETSEKNCYAAGDITGEPMLAHAAYYEADCIVDSFKNGSLSRNAASVPQVLYTTPELASVGLSEREALENEIPVIIRKRPLGGNGRFLAETAGERGICKVVLHKDSGVVLGVHLTAPYASEVITAATMIVQQKLTAKELASIIFPHPTIAEIVKQTIVEEK